MPLRMGVVHKFGRNASVAIAAEPIVDENAIANAFPAAEATTTVVSTDNIEDIADGDGALTVTLQGVNDAGAYIQETVTMTGTTPVACTNDFRIVLRAWVATAGVTGANEGRIDIKHTANIIASIKILAGQSEIAAWYFADTASGGKGGYVTQLDLGVEAISTKTVTFKLVLNRGGVIREQFHTLMNSTNPNLRMPFDAYIRFEPGDLVYVTALGSSGTTPCFARLHIRNL